MNHKKRRPRNRRACCKRRESARWEAEGRDAV